MTKAWPMSDFFAFKIFFVRKIDKFDRKGNGNLSGYSLLDYIFLIQTI